jgi:hypothetical protein
LELNDEDLSNDIQAFDPRALLVLEREGLLLKDAGFGSTTTSGAVFNASEKTRLDPMRASTESQFRWHNLTLGHTE